jgi:hypothetical protein
VHEPAIDCDESSSITGDEAVPPAFSKAAAKAKAMPRVPSADELISFTAESSVVHVPDLEEDHPMELEAPPVCMLELATVAAGGPLAVDLVVYPDEVVQEDAPMEEPPPHIHVPSVSAPSTGMV